MFVSAGARDLLRQRRRADFARQFVEPLVAEARKLGLGPDEIKSLLDDAVVRS
jgi:DNA-binding transcriptional regulator YhcF (GntR family)